MHRAASRLPFGSRQFSPGALGDRRRGLRLEPRGVLFGLIDPVEPEAKEQHECCRSELCESCGAQAGRAADVIGPKIDFNLIAVRQLDRGDRHLDSRRAETCGEVVDEAAEWKADLIVVSSHRPSTK